MRGTRESLDDILLFFANSSYYRFLPVIIAGSENVPTVQTHISPSQQDMLGRVTVQTRKVGSTNASTNF